MSPAECTAAVRKTAAELRARGFAICKIDPVTRRPPKGSAGYTLKSLEPSDFGEGDHLGIVCGPISNGGERDRSLVVCDLDSPEAISLADAYLPPTGMTEGRHSKPRSHRYYFVPHETIPPEHTSAAKKTAPVYLKRYGHTGPAKRSFDHAGTGARVIDFLGTGGPVVCPPSGHPSGQFREWTGGARGEPAVVDFVTLWNATCELARAAGAGGAKLDGRKSNLRRGKHKHSPSPLPSFCAPAPSDVAEGEESLWQKVRAEHPPELCECIAGTLPLGPGQRDYCLSRFVGRLKNHLPDDAPRDQLDRLLYNWWRLAYDAVTTKDFGETSRAFWRKWAELSPLNEARAIRALRDGAAGSCGKAADRLHAGLRAMVRATGLTEFSMSARVASGALGCRSPRTGFRALESLENARRLIVVRRGNASEQGRRATVYRFPDGEQS